MAGYEDPDRPDRPNPDPDERNGSPTGYAGEDDQSAQGWIRDWLSGHPVPGADPGAFMGSYQRERQGGTGHDQALLNALRGLGWDQWSAKKDPTPSETGSSGGLIDMFQGAAPAPQTAGVGQAPVFTPPGYTPPPAFKDPTLTEAQAEPGYAFGASEGAKAIEASAAAKGVLNSGGSLKDLYSWGNNYATQNYQNVDNRARQNYILNTQTQNVDPYQFAYKSAYDAFQPKMAQYNAENGASLFNTGQANTLNYNEWLEAYNIFRNRQRDTIDANAATNG